MMSDLKRSSDGGNNSPKQGSLFSDLSQEVGSAKESSRPVKRKLQVSNGYLLNTGHLSRVLRVIWENRELPRIPRSLLVESTGLPDRQVESVVSIGAAMGLITPGVQLPTLFGLLVSNHDVFLERRGTLAWCHYRGAGSTRNLVWFDVFNRVLVDEVPLTHLEWNARFRKELAGQYSERTLRKVIREEVHFVIDAYLEQKLKELGILETAADETILARRRTGVDHVLLAAMLYDFVEGQERRTFELDDLARIPGSPALLFGLDSPSLRARAEELHNEGWLRYETTHNLDQVRFLPGFNSMEFLTAYYEQREPRRKDESGDSHG